MVLLEKIFYKATYFQISLHKAMVLQMRFFFLFENLSLKYTVVNNFQIFFIILSMFSNICIGIVAFEALAEVTNNCNRL
jgi:hypothetical protein